MTTLREAAQQALEALKMMRDEYGEANCHASDHADAAIYALKAALAEEALQRLTDVNQELEAMLAEPVQCSYCNKFFAQYRCSMESHGECDCPKCQGFCECRGIERTHGIGEKE